MFVIYFSICLCKVFPKICMHTCIVYSSAHTIINLKIPKLKLKFETKTFSIPILYQNLKVIPKQH